MDVTFMEHEVYLHELFCLLLTTSISLFHFSLNTWNHFYIICKHLIWS
jgi:hypothetical protein